MAMIRLLGPVQLLSQEQRHDFGSLKEQCVLAALALERSRPLSVDALIRQLWDNRPPPSARDTLLSYISRLRRTLKRAVGNNAQIVSDPGTYALVIDPEAVDLHRFRRLYRQALAVIDSGDDEHASVLLQEADGLWFGEPLAGLPGDWIQRVRESLQEERHTAHMKRIETELRLGRHAGVIGELHRLAAQHPLDEGIAELRMIALFRCDRQADALNIYRQTRDLLAEELGSEPGPRLQQIHERILRHDLDLAITPRYRHADRAPQPNTLPPDIPDFTGREQELSILTRECTLAASATSVHVIEGMPGIGKTALVVRAAHQLSYSHPDAQLHLRLRDPEPGSAPKTASRCLAELLRMLGVAPMNVPQAVDERASLWRSEMANRRAVVVFDDAISVEQIYPLLPQSPSCCVLITSRRALHGLEDAQRLRLSVLDTVDATELFTRLTSSKNEPGQHTADEIIQRCGGLPLALRLTAGYYRQHQAPEAAHEIIDDLVSTDPNPEQISSGGSLEIRNAFELSYRDLSPEQKRIFRRMGLAPCHQITDHAAAALADTSPSVVRTVIDALLEHHLLLEVGQGHVGLHDLIRAYAHDRADHEDSDHERRKSLQCLLAYYLDNADRADRILHPHRRRLEITPLKITRAASSPHTRKQAQAWMETEWYSALQMAEYAIRHEWKRAGAFLVHALAQFLETQGHWEHAATAHESAVQAFREIGDKRAVAQSLLELGFIQFRTGCYEDALKCASESFNTYHTIADPHAEAEALDKIGIIYWSTARYREAIAHCQEALALYESIGNSRGQADALAHCAICYWHLGRYDESISNFNIALRVYREIGDRRGEANTLNNIGDVQQHLGYHRDAVDLYRQSSEIFEEISGRQSSAIVQNNLGNVHRYKGKYRKALRCYRNAMATYRATGDRRNIADALNNIGQTYRLMGRYGEALIHHEKASIAAAEINESYEQTRALYGMAGINQETGNYHAALDCYQRALADAHKINDTYQEALIHDGIASTMLQLHGPQAARIHWRQALDLFQGLDVPEAQTAAIRLQATMTTSSI